MKSQGTAAESPVEEMEDRACGGCEAVWLGTLECPYCGSPGEPLAPPECIYCGSGDLRYDPALDAVDCVSCGRDSPHE